MTLDHGAGWYDRIEIEGGEGQPYPKWLTADWMPCLDCRANAFLKWTVGPQLGIGVRTDGQWHLTIAHDENCPKLREIEGRAGR